MNPSPVQPLCNEEDTRTVHDQPPEALEDASRCSWPTTVEARCSLSRTAKPLLPDAGIYPLLVCHRPIEQWDGPHCRVVLSPSER